MIFIAQQFEMIYEHSISAFNEKARGTKQNGNVPD
jgi:hypothetical protein